MKTIFTEKHKLRNAKTELYGGQLVEPFERPSRAEFIIERVRQAGLGAIVDPQDFGLDPVYKIHNTHYVDFLQVAWDHWKAENFAGEAIPTTWPARRMSDRVPEFIEGRLGYYSMAVETSISDGTWEAAYWSAQVALTGAAEVQGGEKGVFALCRPPGHHSALDMYGGYCFLNNAAIAAQSLLDNGAKRVAVVDVDFHHGNGTQDIFYERNDVLFASLHGDPSHAFPHFLGYSEEKGEGDGAGFNINYPMKPGTRFEEWRAALADALDNVRHFAPDALVISLGVDTFENDPISFFKLKSEDFLTYGADIAQLQLPTLFVMEGGYDIDEIGINTVNVLQGFTGE
ncbi:acetylpolyamine aminohydrolase [Chromatiales bacterium (ex Bugula neritina AB1)]|nr:acetylpolyamine aminohydrolase [Chromatiales bacterium (ex Bugula neritina AB1)]